MLAVRVSLLSLIVGACGPKNHAKEPSYPAPSQWVAKEGDWWRKANPCPGEAKLYQINHWRFCATAEKEVPPQSFTIQTMPSLHEALILQSFVASSNHRLPTLHGQLTIKGHGNRTDMMIYRGKLHGSLKGFQPIGSFDCMTKRGKLHGACKVKLSAGQPWRGQFENGRLVSSTRGGNPEVAGGNGAIDTVIEGAKITGQFSDGYASGTWTTTTKGKTTEVLFTAPGEATTEYLSEGVKVTIAYKDWNPNGWGTLSSEERQQKERFFYEHGKKKKMETYLAGKLRRVVALKFDLRDGEASWYWRNGKLRARGFFKKGVPHGVFTYFDESGNKKFTRELAEGTGDYRSVEPHQSLSTMWRGSTAYVVSHFLGLQVLPGTYDGSCDGKLEFGKWRKALCVMKDDVIAVTIQGSTTGGLASGVWQVSGVGRRVTSHKITLNANMKNGLLHGDLDIRIEGQGNGQGPGTAKYNFENGLSEGPFEVLTKTSEERGTYRQGKMHGKHVVKSKGRIETTFYDMTVAKRSIIEIPGKGKQECTIEGKVLDCVTYANGKRVSAGKLVRKRCKGYDLPKGMISGGASCADGQWTLYKKNGRVLRTETYDAGKKKN